MAEGEVALIPHHLEAALHRPPVHVRFGSAASDLDLYVLYAEYSALARAPDLKTHARRALEAAVRLGHPLYQGIAQRALGVGHRLDGEWAEAEKCFGQALSLFQAVPAPWQSARTLWAFAELEHDRGNMTGTRDYFARALSDFEALGATPDAERAAQALRSF